VQIGVCALLAVLLFLGGANHHNALQLLGAELTSIPMLLVAACRISAADWRENRLALVLLGLVLLFPLLQLIPLPPAVWASLPERRPLAEMIRLATGALPWRPLSLNPDQTLSCFYFLFPAAAMFLISLTGSTSLCRALAVTIVLVAAFSLLMGVAQVGFPTAEFLYPYAYTNYGSAVGVFANRNHQAIMLVSAIPLWTAVVLTRRDGDRGPPPLPLIGLLTAVFLIGLAAVQSRAGIILSIPALIGSSLLLARAGVKNWKLYIGAIIVAPLLATVVLVGGLGPSGILSRFKEPVSADTRALVLPAEFRTGRSVAPWGSGLGSFPEAFQRFEPLNLVQPDYLNHAHDEYIELWVETGWAGCALGAVVFVFIVLRAIRPWLVDSEKQRLTLARACSIVLALLLCHSVVDYPLRTPAMAVVFAVAAGIVARRGSGIAEPAQAARKSKTAEARSSA
jgi:O-antigen ligase